MKTLKLICASFFALMLSVTIVSCGDDGDFDKEITRNPIPELDKNVVSKLITTIDASAKASYAKTIKMADGPIESCILLDDGTILVAKRVAYLSKTTRSSSLNYVSGTYEIKGSDVVAKVDGYTITFPYATTIEKVNVNGTDYDASVVPGQTDASSVSLCRTWYPTDYEVVVYTGSKAFVTYEAKTLLELQKKIANGIESDIDLLKGEVSKIAFLDNNTIVTGYEGKEEEVADWKWTNASKGELKATFGPKDNYKDLDCVVRFDKGTPNICFIIIDFKVDMKDIDGKQIKVDAKTIITMKDA